MAVWGFFAVLAAAGVEGISKGAGNPGAWQGAYANLLPGMADVHEADADSAYSTTVLRIQRGRVKAVKAKREERVRGITGTAIRRDTVSAYVKL